MQTSNRCLCPLLTPQIWSKSTEHIYMQSWFLNGFPGGSDGKESFCNVGDLGSIPGWGRSSGGGTDNPLQYSCLENPMDRGAWLAIVHGVTKSQTQLSDQHFHFHGFKVWSSKITKVTHGPCPS